MNCDDNSGFKGKFESILQTVFKRIGSVNGTPKEIKELMFIGFVDA